MLSNAPPVPDSTVALHDALPISVTVNVALREPVAVGVKVTLMVQVPLAAKVEGLRGQLLVCPKSPGFVPVKAMLVILSAVLLGFERVTALAALGVPTFWFPKSGTGDGERTGSDTPVPDTPAVWGLLLALSVTVNVALRDPMAVGVKVTLMVQVPLAAKVEGLMGQLLVCPKSPGLVQVERVHVWTRAAVLGLERVTA